ncbi:hypothetical protein OQJ18_06735 [Fluoribacter dumoffii]|uniref:hypothetical protein n=1 Tax=Fluoribacter dumoffii TaxID=463 RepID=UPI0022447F96|nr:hypothetical protein [Fluoribacter dumoffii]MCW8418213.1 hypothetical protein [Fluoribacter dumoffii]MCW8453945.1 hypothetical protein [Fluoribacter dumoffii]MCW8461984.1 hypothetical protein [Fluoribacter dumoffii]MCW8482196.1 hypothetical protein [Fluoribacter dumoffii]
MNKYEREQLQKIAKALTSTEDLTQEARLDLVFSALFELDKIQKGQLDGLSEEQLEEVFSGDITKSLIALISATKDTDNTGIKDVRSILSNVMRNPWRFGLSGKMQLNSFFHPYAETSIAPNLSEIANELEVSRLLVLKRTWIARNIFPEQYSDKEPENAQIFVDALRKGDYARASEFASWICKKYSDPLLNPGRELPAADTLIPCAAYELAQTDVRAEDLTAIVHFMDHAKDGDAQYSATTMWSGLQSMHNRLWALTKKYPEEHPQQILQMMRAEHEEFLNKPNPFKSLIEGCDFVEVVDLSAHFTPDKINAFANQNRDSLTANLIVLNTDEATLQDIEVLVDIKNRIFEYIHYLENHRSDKTSVTFNNRLNAANEMLTVLQKGGTIKGDVIPAIKEQMAVIEKNKPGLAELGFLGYLVEHLIDRFLPKPTMRKETTKTLEELQTFVEPKKDEPKQEQPEVQSKDIEMDVFPKSGIN